MELLRAIVLVVYLAHVFGVHQEQTQRLCHEVLRINCISQYMPDDNEELCGTDGHTYPNTCLFVQAKCKNISLDQAHQGKCAHTLNLFHLSFWRDLMNETYIQNASVPETAAQSVDKKLCDVDYACPDTLDPLCGRDEMFYQNACMFEKARCNNPNLKIQPLLSKCQNPD